jgi:hypothetical protein
MKKKKIFSVLGFILIVVFMVTACSKKDSKSENMLYDSNANYGTSTTAQDTGTAESEPQLSATEDLAVNFDQDKKDGGATEGINNSSAITAEEPTTQSQDKIIRRFYMDVETQTFDGLITKIDSEIDRLGGYVENSKISGKRFYNNNEARYGSIVVRIPRDKVDEFVNSVDENANVINKQESTENVTLQYTDMESRKKSLEIEQERLFVLLEKTDTLDNIVTLESRLSDIRYELQNYETQLRTYDNLVEYSSVTLSIQEVERITPVVEKKQTVADRIHNGFSDTVYNISEGFKNFFVWFVVNFLYLLIWGVIIAVVALIARRYYKKWYAKYVMPPTQGPNPPTNGSNPPTKGNE